MIKTMIEGNRYHFISGLNQGIPQSNTLLFNLYNQYDLLKVRIPGYYRAYFLPWYPKTGLYIDLPSKPSSSIFLTADLSGCCIKIQNFGKYIRVCHANLQSDGINESLPRLSVTELFTYGEDCYWLVPGRTPDGIDYRYRDPQYAVLDKQGNPRIILYEFGERRKDMLLGYCPASFWGEYHNNGWKFYYQNGIGDIYTVHEFTR